VVSGQEITRLPVRSALFKQRTGGLVIRWATTSEHPLLNVFAKSFFLNNIGALENDVRDNSYIVY
jgi:hypothetical protein